MPQLIQNGDVLTGTSNDSANILYSEPDGSSKNVQDKIEELNNSLEWKLVGTVGYRTDLTLPQNYNELYVEISTSADRNWLFNTIIPKISIDKTTTNYYYFGTPQDNTNVRSDITSTTIQIGYASTDNPKLTVYYR